MGSQGDPAYKPQGDFGHNEFGARGLVMVEGFENSLRNLKNRSVTVSDARSFPEPGIAGIDIAFSDGSRLRAAYWRLTKDAKTCISSFDHQQKYGLALPIDAISELRGKLQNHSVVEARFDHESGDLLFQFDGNTKLQVLSLTSYEDWEIHFANGTGEYSNFVRFP